MKNAHLNSKWMAATLVLLLFFTFMLPSTNFAADDESGDLSIEFNQASIDQDGGIYFPELTVTGDRIRGIQISFTSIVKDTSKINIPSGYGGFNLSDLDNGNTIRIIDVIEGKTSEEVENFLRNITYSMDQENKASIQVILYREPIDNVVFFYSGYYDSEENEYFPGTGHYYEYVEYKNLPASDKIPNREDMWKEEWGWLEAYNQAQSKTFLGQGGYLATVTSEEENEFLYKISGGKTGWFGGTRKKLDGYNTSNATVINDDNGVFWYWA